MTHNYICMYMYFIRKIFSHCILLVRWDTHPVSNCSSKTAMQIPIVGLRYTYVYNYTYICIYAYKVCMHEKFVLILHIASDNYVPSIWPATVYIYIYIAKQKHLGCKKARPIRSSSYLTMGVYIHSYTCD